MTGQHVATVNKSQDLVAYFEDRKASFAEVMDAGNVDKFMRTMKNAIIRDPAIAEASKQSVYLEIQKAAADGLVLDGREAVLTTFNTKRRWQEGGQWKEEWVKQVVYIPMIRGLKKLVHQSPQIADWHTDLFYEKEYLNGLLDPTDPERRKGFFEYVSGDSPSIKHVPMLVGDKGPVVGAYSVVRLRSGVLKVEVMTIAKLNAIKARTKSKRPGKGGAPDTITGPWATDEEEMFRKTVARRHFKSLPLDDKTSSAFERVDGLYDFNGDASDQVEVETVAPPKAVTNKKTKPSAAAKLAAAAAEQHQPDHGGQTIEHDEEAGEEEEDTSHDHHADDEGSGDRPDPRDEF